MLWPGPSRLLKKLLTSGILIVPDLVRTWVASRQIRGALLTRRATYLPRVWAGKQVSQTPPLRVSIVLLRRALLEPWTVLVFYNLVSLPAPLVKPLLSGSAKWLASATSVFPYRGP